MTREGVWVSKDVVYQRDFARDTGTPTAEPAAGASFESLFQGIIGSAFGYAMRLTRNKADAEDLLQETALLSFRAFASFTPGSNFKAWFFRILMREFWGRHRIAQRRPSTIAFDDLPELFLFSQSREVGLPCAGPDAAAQLIDKLGTERVSEALDALPTDYRMVATLYFMQDFSYQEIADVLEIPVGTVRSRLHRGRKMLQQALWQLARDSGIVQALSQQAAEVPPCDR